MSAKKNKINNGQLNPDNNEPELDNNSGLVVGSDEADAPKTSEEKPVKKIRRCLFKFGK